MMIDHLEGRMRAHRRWRAVMLAALTLRIVRALG